MSAMRNGLIVHADDFGETEQITLGICEVIDAGIVTSTSVMANMPATDFALGRASERTTFVTKELALEQRFRECRTIQADEGPFAPRARVVDRPRHQFLANAAFAPNQDGGSARCRAGNLLLHVCHQLAVADDLALHTQPFAKLQVLVADLIEVFGQLLLASEVFQRHRNGIGHGQREFQIVGVGDSR